jgi:tetratricopeptide (TPR) repeat protein
MAAPLAGCSRGETASAKDKDKVVIDLTENSSELTPAAISNVVATAELDDEPQAEQGSPDWLLSEIRKTLGEPLPEAEPKALAQIHRARHEKTIELATEAIGKTHADPAQEAVFNEAVRLLLEARLELAMTGDKQETEALYDDAQSLYKRDPKSKASAEAAFVLARFAHLNAQKHAQTEPKWLEEFARQARLFAENYPQESSRAVSLLYAAGWSCELRGLTNEAIGCYALLAEKYPESPQAQQVVAVMRRLKLPGQPLELAGPTLGGVYVNIDDFLGKPVLVVFWSTGTKSFVDQLPLIQQVAEAHKDSGFTVIGVNLDEDQAALKAFVKEHSLTWPQIFPVEPAERRWNHPIARYYGVRDIPMLWLVDRNGKVIDTLVDPAKLEQQVSELSRP